MKKIFNKTGLLVLAGLLVLTIAGIVFAAIEASNTPIVTRPGTVAMQSKSFWAVNCSDSNALVVETIKAAPGTGKSLFLQYIVINCNADDSVTIQEDANTLLGPFAFDAAGGPFLIMDFGVEGIQLDSNSALGVSAGIGTTAVAVFARGYTSN